MNDNRIGIYLFLLGSIIFLLDACFLNPISYYYLVGSILFILGCLYFIKNNRKMLITCINKIVEIDLLNKKRRIYKGKGGVKTWIPVKNSNPLKEELVDFEKSVRYNQQPIVGVKESCKAVNIALEVEKLINK